MTGARPPLPTTVLLLLAALVAGLAATGCGCGSKALESGRQMLASPKPRDRQEPMLLLLYMDDSASMDEHRKEYGEWAIRLLRAIGPQDPEKVGVHFSTFRSNVIGKADLKLTGKGMIEKAIIEYEDAHPAPDPDGPAPTPDRRDQGTSLKEVLKDAKRQIEGSKASSALLAIFCDGGVEDGKNGDPKGALAAAKALETLPGGTKLKVLVLGVTEDENGALIRQQEAFWSKTKLDVQIGKQTDTEAVISSAAPDFGSGK